MNWNPVWTPPFVHTGNGTQRKAEKNGFLKPDVPPRPTSVMRGVQDERKLHKGSQHRNTKVVDEGTALQDRLARLALEREQLNLTMVETRQPGVETDLLGEVALIRFRKGFFMCDFP